MTSRSDVILALLPWGLSVLACAQKEEEMPAPTVTVATSKPEAPPTATGSPLVANKAAIPNHQAFPVARMKRSGERLSVGEWTSSVSVVPKRVLTSYVVATWCPYSQDVIEKLSVDPVLRASVDLILVYEDEIETAIAKGVRDGELSKAEASEVKKKLRARKQLVIDPKAIKANLPFYMIRKGQFDISRFPSAVVCNEDDCHQVERLAGL